MKWIGLMLIAGGLVGCRTTPPLYSWGNYEEMVYLTYSKPGQATPEFQIERMEADLAKAKGKGAKMPPGFYAYLGSLYSQLGKSDQACQALEAEKAQFPESTVLVDRMLANLKRN